jgi:hypothetical protein
VLCVDEKCQIQASARTAPILPMLPGTPERDARLQALRTSSLYAALNLTTGKVLGALHSRHRAIEFKQFLQTIDRDVPAELDIHVVLDNSSTHKRRRSRSGCSPTHASSCTSPRPAHHG